MLVNLSDVLIPAKKSGYAIGAFNVYNMETIEVVFDAAVSLNIPVIIAFGEKYSHINSINLISQCVHELANKTLLPIVLHLDHCKSKDLIIQAIQAGFTSVMYDGSSLVNSDNIRITSEIVKIAHAARVTVEAELGYVPAEDTGEFVPEDQLTKPDEAKEFVEMTNCDALAIAVGTVHGNYIGKPKIYHNRLKEIAKAISVPLVLHGGSGNTDEDIVLAIDEGISKININTEISNAAVKELKKIFRNDYSSHLSLLSDMIKGPMLAVVKEKMKLFSRGKIGLV
ncbi:MAG TPA: class II fructose-bisphosphate aldolase [Candidatus Atribacteria bacterium]|nr:class II fructose-bisphosphate aldolase [Candidatus Atribacteria bacterium]